MLKILYIPKLQLVSWDLFLPAMLQSVGAGVDDAKN